MIDWWGIRITKETAIGILKRQKKHSSYWLPFDLMCYEYGKRDNPCDECNNPDSDDFIWEEAECIHWNWLETDDIETLEEDVDNYYKNFELRFIS